MTDPRILQHRVAKLARLRESLSIWEKQPDETMFGATIQEFGGLEISVRIPKATAIAALKDAIAGLE
jgi:hypothetical protein